MDKEIWKDIPNYNGLYQVSSLGRVKSLWYSKERILKGNVNTSGYYDVKLYYNKIKKSFRVHQLVTICFLNHTPNGLTLIIDHINDNKLDNRVENLQIVTPRFNAHKTQGRYSSKYKGVYWNKQNKKWMSKIRISGCQKYLGYFTDEYEAHLAYQNAINNLNS